MEYKPAVLKIFYRVRGALKAEAQGKFFYLDGKPVFLADMTQAKLFYKFNGYAISNQILEAFEKANIKPQIIYRRRDLGTLYYANRSVFQTHGIPVEYGGHSQWILPLKNWDAKQGTIKDPKNLPVIELSKWLKGKPQVVFTPDGFVLTEG